LEKNRGKIARIVEETESKGSCGIKVPDEEGKGKEVDLYSAYRQYNSTTKR